METKVIASKQWTLNVRDLIKGFLMAVLGAVLTIIQESLRAGSLEFDWKKIGIVAATAGVAYLLKNLFEPSKVIVVKGSDTSTEDLKKNIKRVI